MQEINLQPVFEYLDGFKMEIKADIGDLKVRVGNLENSTDRLTKIVTTLRDEFVVMNYRVGKLETKKL